MLDSDHCSVLEVSYRFCAERTTQTVFVLWCLFCGLEVLCWSEKGFSKI